VSPPFRSCRADAAVPRDRIGRRSDHGRVSKERDSGRPLGSFLAGVDGTACGKHGRKTVKALKVEVGGMRKSMKNFSKALA